MTEADEKLMGIINEKLGFKLRRRVIIKPLEVTKITVEREVPIYLTDENGEYIKDENGIRRYEETEKITEEVESNYRKGIIIKMPYDLKQEELDVLGIKEGDVVMYHYTAGQPFDQVKDSIFMDPYNIIAIYE